MLLSVLVLKSTNQSFRMLLATVEKGALINSAIPCLKKRHAQPKSLGAQSLWCSSQRQDTTLTFFARLFLVCQVPWPQLQSRVRPPILNIIFCNFLGVKKKEKYGRGGERKFVQVGVTTCEERFMTEKCLCFPLFLNPHTTMFVFCKPPWN